MDSELLKILNEELMELKDHTGYLEKRLEIEVAQSEKRDLRFQKMLDKHDRMFERTTRMLDKHSKTLDKHSIILDQHTEALNRQQGAFEVLFKNMTTMGERLDIELARLKREQ